MMTLNEWRKAYYKNILQCSLYIATITIAVFELH